MMALANALKTTPATFLRVVPSRRSTHESTVTSKGRSPGAGTSDPATDTPPWPRSCRRHRRTDTLRAPSETPIAEVSMLANVQDETPTCAAPPRTASAKSGRYRHPR